MFNIMINSADKNPGMAQVSPRIVNIEPEMKPTVTN